MQASIPAKISVWYFFTGFSLSMGTAIAGPFFDFIPSRSWGLNTGIATGLITAWLSWYLVPGVFNRLQRNRLFASALVVVLMWCCSWYSACELGGVIVTSIIGMPHSQVIIGTPGRNRHPRWLQCEYFVSLETSHDLWGSRMCLGYAMKTSDNVVMKLYGIASFAGFNVRSIESMADVIKARDVRYTKLTDVSQTMLMLKRVDDLNISIGDSIETVQSELHTNMVPEQSQSATVDGASSIRLRDRGIWIFFDKQGKVYTIRVDRPYSDSIDKIAIGDSQMDVLNILGRPA
ncbi:MAG TPA: hypothetical protein VHL14_11495, partial [Steroidobacteraceae bacterium]|nr:hypothetical protein [Steroidobacteraceae bacterium]